MIYPVVAFLSQAVVTLQLAYHESKLVGKTGASCKTIPRI